MRRLLVIVLTVFAVGVVAACSGGGSSQPVVAPTPQLTGQGSTAAVNAKISFKIIIPAANSSATGHRRAGAGRFVGGFAQQRRAEGSASPTPAPSGPYVSPVTGAIVLTLAEINGISPQVAPAPIPAIPVTCQNCTFTAADIPAAIGVDRYFVQTYTEYAAGQATGNLISTGFIDVTVPVTSTPTLGGAAALSIGGYVAQIVLSPSILNFQLYTPGDQTMLVEALDAGGATIVGQVQYATPITVALGNSQDLTLNGSSAGSLTLTGTTSQAIDVHYDGGFSYGTTVSASSVDENGQPVAAPTGYILVGVPTPVPTPTPTPTVKPSPTPTPIPTKTPTPTPPGYTPPPTVEPSPISSFTPTPVPTLVGTPIPTPSPTPKPPPTPTPTLPPPNTSLYIADAAADTISEYGFVTQLEATGQAPYPVPTPRRVLAFNYAGTQASAHAPAGFNCSASGYLNTQGTGYGTSGVAVAANGTIFTLPNCIDANFNAYILGYPASTVGLSVPTIFDPINEAALGGYSPQGGEALAYSAKNVVYAEMNANTAAVVGFPATSNNQPPTITTGQNCYQEPGISITCSIGNNPGGFYVAGNGQGFSVDSLGYAYIPAAWNDQPTIGTASGFVIPPAIIDVGVSSTSASAATTPHTVIDGFYALLGGTGTPPLATAIDGSTLYVLVPGAVLNQLNGNTYDPGLSSCPAPSPNAPINTATSADSGTTNCVDGQPHEYLVGYSLAGTGIYSPLVIPVLELTPSFTLGGDTKGRFGCSSAGGQYLAASAGFVYVINQQLENCGTTQPSPEIDVYNTNGLSGNHTDIAPVAVIPLPAGFPSALTIGPSGSVIGGQAVARRPLARGTDRYGIQRQLELRHRQVMSHGKIRRVQLPSR